MRNPPSLVGYDQDDNINQRLGAVKISSAPISPTRGGGGGTGNLMVNNGEVVYK